MKEGKVGRKDGQMLPGEDEPLHALVTANTMENVKKAVEQVCLLVDTSRSDVFPAAGADLVLMGKLFTDPKHPQARNRDA